MRFLQIIILINSISLSAQKIYYITYADTSFFYKIDTSWFLKEKLPDGDYFVKGVNISNQIQMVKYRNNVKEGVEYEYWDNCNLKRISEFNSGRLTIQPIEFYETGQIQKYISYGEKEKRIIMFYKSGNIEIETIVEYKTGIERNTIYFPSGGIKIKSIWFMNTPIDTNYSYYKSGVIESKLFKDPEGKIIWHDYFENGKLNSTGELQMCTTNSNSTNESISKLCKNGLWQFYDNNGKIIRIEIWKDDVMQL